MNNKILSITVLLIAILILTQSRIKADADGASLQIMVIPPDARSSAMGNTFTAIADDIYAHFYNPAGLINLKTFESCFSYTLWFADLKLFDIGIGVNPKEKIGSFCFNLKFLSFGQIFNSNKDEELKEEFFNAYSLVVSLSYAHFIVKKYLFAGIKTKYARETWEGIDYNLRVPTNKKYGVAGFAVDLGLYGIIFKNLKYGINFQNISYTKPIDAPALNAMPFNIRIGLSYYIKEFLVIKKMIVASDLTFLTFASRIKMHIGSEIYIGKLPEIMDLICRFGIELPQDTKYFFDYFKFGFGLRFKSWHIDWAFYRKGNVGGFVNSFSFHFKL